MGILDKILRAGEGKTLRTLESIARQVNAIEDDFVAMTDEELRGLTAEYRTRLDNGETLDDLLPEAFATVREAGITPADIQYASLYDSFTITVLMQLEDLGFCKKGEGGRFVADGNLISGVGTLPFNTDGGGLCNNHPANRGGITKVIEAVRQLRGEAHPKVQVPDCTLALAQGTGGLLGSRHGSATLILERN